MAEFCKPCAKDRGFEPDFVGLVEEGFYAQVLCEGCGFVVVDHAGEPVFREEPHGISFEEFLKRKEESASGT